MGFNVTCTPGHDVAAAFSRVTPELPALAMYLDPVSMAIQLRSSPGGRQVLATFFRELSYKAAKLASEINRDDQRNRPAKREWPQPPGDDDPVDAHIVWMEQCAARFDETAVNGGGYGLSQSSAVRAAEYLRRTAKELAEGLDAAGEAAG